MADYLPFPTFGGQQQGSGITAVQLPASAMRFPSTSYTPRQKVPEPDPIETIAPFLPLVTEGIMGLFQDEPEQLTRGEYLESIGGLKEAEEGGAQTLQNLLHNRRQEAKADTYELYGEREERDTFGLGDIAHIVAASQMGRGAEDYAQTYSAIKKAEETARLATQTDRGTYLNKALEEVDNLTYKVFEDADAAALGVDDRRSGFSDPRGEVYVMNNDRTGYVNIKDLAGNWIEQKYEGESLTEQLKNPDLVHLRDLDKEAATKDSASLGMLDAANELIAFLDQAVLDDTQNPLTTVADIANIGNSIASNVNQVMSWMGGGDTAAAFADATGSGEMGGSGVLAGQLYQALEGGDPNEIDIAMRNFEEANEISFEDKLGQIAYNNVRTKGIMLQLAYMAAAANGQTGRTLSDRDLALHLDMVGFGSTQRPSTARHNLISFIDTVIESSDTLIQGSISRHRMGRIWPTDDDNFTAILSGYWVPDTIENEEGKVVHDWGAANFRDFYSRHGNMPAVQKWRVHGRIPPPGEAEVGTGTRTGDIITDTQQDLQNLSVIRGLSGGTPSQNPAP